MDLSLSLRYTNLPNHAQLELVQSSRSPSVVSVALQLPPSENSLRLTDKFPSITSVWQILRRFESGAAGVSGDDATRSNAEREPRNFTQKGWHNAAEGPDGKPLYRSPVVSIINRQLTNFEDFQNTLAQLGYNQGSVLLRLDYMDTSSTLEEATKQISNQFRELETAPESNASTHSNPESGDSHAPEASFSVVMTDISQPMESNRASIGSTSKTLGVNNEVAETDGLETSIESQNIPERSILVFANPINSTPQAASFTNDDSDYETTIAAAKLHQAKLVESGRNQRLLSDKELANAEQQKVEKLASVEKILIRIRMPDQSQIQGTFYRHDDGTSLFEVVREALEHPNEKFSLRYINVKGKQTSLSDGPEKLIGDLDFQGRVLISLVWDPNIALNVRTDPALKREYRDVAQQLKVENLNRTGESTDMVKSMDSGNITGRDRENSTPEEKENKLKKLLGRLSRK